MLVKGMRKWILVLLFFGLLPAGAMNPLDPVGTFEVDAPHTITISNPMPRGANRYQYDVTTSKPGLVNGYAIFKMTHDTAMIRLEFPGLKENYDGIYNPIGHVLSVNKSTFPIEVPTYSINASRF